MAAVVAIQVVAIATPVGLYRYRKLWEAEHYRARVVGEAAADVVSVGSRSGFLEGCGTAVFELATGADPPQVRYPASAGWMATPYAGTGDGLSLLDRWLVGLPCADMGAELAGRIDAALKIRDRTLKGEGRVR